MSLLKRCPALSQLSGTDEPKPEHVRACLMELVRVIDGQPTPSERPTIYGSVHGDGQVTINEAAQLRDEFACAALRVVGHRMDSTETNWTPERISAVAYQIADAMLREKGGQS